MLRTALQLAAVVALIALVFGLPQLREQPPVIADPAPQPLVEAAAAPAADPRPAQRRPRPQAEGRRDKSHRQPRPALKAKHAATKQRRKVAAERPAVAQRPAPTQHAAAPAEPSVAAAPANEFGWP